MRKDTGLRMVVIVLGAVILAGCGTTLRQRMARPANLEPEDLWTIARPLEFGLKSLGPVDARASASYLFGIQVGGDQGVCMKSPIFGAVSGNLVEGAACKRVLDDEPDADALYIMRSEITRRGLPPFWWKTEAKIKAEVLGVENLGTISEERADRLRLIEKTRELLLGAPDSCAFLGARE